VSKGHRQTAADWSGGESSALYAYATTGAVPAGIAEEIEDRLAMIERAEVGGELDRVGERERLRALLHHVEPKLVTSRAYDIGQEHGRGAAQRWLHDALDGRPSGESVATASHLLQGIEEGDPAIFDLASEWDEVASPAEIAARSGWPEPGIDDVAAHRRWEAAQVDICGAYVTGFVDAFWDVAAVACRRALAESGPYVRPAAASTVSGRAQGEKTNPPGWVVEPIGQWHGVESEVVYDPRRFEVTVSDYSSMWSEKYVAAFRAAGWEQQAVDGSAGFWTRDRVASARNALARFDQRADVIPAEQADVASRRPAPEVEL
jgi:hypothetical protein